MIPSLHDRSCSNPNGEIRRVFLREVVIVDPASRLHTQANLMKELAKARRMVAGKLGTATRRCS
jgi:hypothetical protein